jgi:hypothetical protein
MPKGLTTNKAKEQVMPRPAKPLLTKITPRLTNAIYQIQNTTKNSKMGN